MNKAELLSKAKKLGFKKGAFVKDEEGIYKLLSNPFISTPYGDVVANVIHTKTKQKLKNGILIDCDNSQPTVKLYKMKKKKSKKKTKKVQYKQGGVKLLVKRKSGLLHPRTRMQEVLCLLLEVHHPMTYVGMCDELDNVNCHKAVQYWKLRGVKFKDPKRHRQNRFGRMGHFKRFSIANRAHAKKVYRKNIRGEE